MALVLRILLPKTHSLRLDSKWPLLCLAPRYVMVITYILLHLQNPSKHQNHGLAFFSSDVVL